jgi:hypothetical protein
MKSIILDTTTHTLKLCKSFRHYLPALNWPGLATTKERTATFNKLCWSPRPKQIFELSRQTFAYIKCWKQISFEVMLPSVCSFIAGNIFYWKQSLSLWHLQVKSIQLGPTEWVPRTRGQSQVSIYRCPRRNVPDFRRVCLMVKYTDITQDTYVQSWTVTEIMAREVWNFLTAVTNVLITTYILKLAGISGFCDVNTCNWNQTNLLVTWSHEIYLQ